MERTLDGAYPGGDLFDIVQNTFYLWADLVSSGMSPTAWDGLEGDDAKKWSILRLYLPNVINTGYYLGIIRGLRSVYGFDGMIIDDSNWKMLNEQIRMAYKDVDWPEKVLRETTHIECAINDVDGFNMNRSLFLPAIKFDYLLRGGTRAGRNQIETTDGEHIETFDEYVAYLDRKIHVFKVKGAVALKTVTPYYRGLDYVDIPEVEARRTFQTTQEPSPQQQKTIEDFAFHYIIRKAIELDLPVQIHTGMLAWNRVFLEYCNPTALNHLFIQYPECRFILFHGGFPYTGETGVLVKTFPNVYLDFCWLPWISMSITKRCLHEWLDLIPHSKLMWGGDAHRAECVHGHWLLAQQAVVEVLSEKIHQRRFSLETAAQIAEGIFRNNAIRIFQLNLSQA
jgi:uncharacterized protein